MSEEKEKKVMVGYTKENLLDLLPAVYRQRDSEIEGPLEDLMGMIAEHVTTIEKDIDGLYNDWFIETCSEWVTSYIADLVGTRSLSVSRASLNTGNPLSQRAYVANTIAYRRRKGTASMLEQLARDITLWGSKAVEFFQLLATTQHLNHPRPANHRTPDLRDTAKLETLDTPFGEIAHTLEVRRIKSNRGYYNIPNIGIFLWRLQSFPSINAQAFQITPIKFMFNPFGYAVTLFNRPVTEQEISHLAEEINVPAPIRIRAIHENLNRYYGPEKSVFIRVKYSDEENYQDIAAREVEVCNLSKWDEPGWSPPNNGKVSIDPLTGKMAMPRGAEEVRVSYHYGFSGSIGGGNYVRPDLNMGDFPPSSHPAFFNISKMQRPSLPAAGTVYTNIQDAINAWKATGQKNTVFVIHDSENYDENIEIALPPDSTVVIRAAQEQRPILKPIKVNGETGSKLVLEGLWIENNVNSGTPLLQIGIGSIKMLAVRHSTLVPGRIHPSNNLSIYLEGGNSGIEISMEKTICGRVGVLHSLVFDWDDMASGPANEEGRRLILFLKKTFNAAWLPDDIVFNKSGPTIHAAKDGHSLDFTRENRGVILTIDGLKKNHELVLKDNKVYMKSDASFMAKDSIIDASGDNPALSAGTAKMENTSIFGKTTVDKLAYASNTIFTDVVTSKITQQGCVRFSYIPPGSKTPWRYMCQPSGDHIHQSVIPHFTSMDYGDPGYAQLHKTVAKEIFEGADNGAEMGAFNHLFQPQRIKDLGVSLNEYLRFGLEAGVYLVT